MLRTLFRLSHSQAIVNSVMNDVKIDVRFDPSPEEKDLIVNSLVEFNESQVGDARFKEFRIFASGGCESIVAGLLGFILWNGCFISTLWVAEPVRRKGIGRQLLAKAEELAVRNGCDHIHLDAFDFQARGFYEKNGFHVFGTIEDYPIGHKRYYLIKKLGRKLSGPPTVLSLP
jgi:ribosomal protein S18 acetylase RimI-like enzyme